MSDISQRLRAACDGHPHAKIAWPHRLLHEGADENERLLAALIRIRDVLRPADNAENVETVGKAVEIATAAVAASSSLTSKDAP